MGVSKSKEGGHHENGLAEHDAQLKAGDEDTLVVLNDYPTPDVSQPIFKMGEKLKAIAEEGSWWKVRSLTTGHDNYIPNICVAKVYHGWLFEGVVRQKAEELLQLPGNVVGSFMIRESPMERGVYSLSVRHRTVKHYKIFRMDNSWYYVSPRLTFQCLEDMVNHYSDAADGLCCVLTAPCLALTRSSNPLNGAPQPPPVVMRRNFDWKTVDCSQLLDPSPVGGSRDLMSYGVRNSIASYLSMAEDASNQEACRKNRKQKSKSVYLMSDPNNTLYQE